MPIAIKDAGVWKTADIGKLAILQGNETKFLDAMAVATPAKANYWPIRDAQGQTVCDDIVGTKDATYVGTDIATVHPNPFDGTKQHYIRLPDAPYKGKSAFTLECRFRTTASGPILGINDGGAVGGAAPGGGFVPVIYMGTPGVLRCELYPLAPIPSIGVVNDGAWHHAALTYNGSVVTLYVDGVSQGSVSGNPYITTYAWLNTSQIGAAYDSGARADWGAAGWRFFTGSIEDFAVYNSALTATQIQTHANTRPRWVYPAKAAIKVGGAWIDSGYLGYPAVPAAPTVANWNYANHDQVNVQWTVPSGGAPIASYDVQIQDSAGTVLNGYNQSTLTRLFGGMANLTNYQFRVRSKGASGLASAWSPLLKVRTGRAQINTPRSEYRTRAWYNNRYHNPLGVGEWLVCANGANVSTHTIQFNLEMTASSADFSGSPAGRKVNWLINNADGGYIGYRAALYSRQWNEQRGWGVSAVAWQGVFLVGAWSGTGGTWNVFGTVHLWGTETYLESWTDVTPAVNDSYW